MKEHSVRGLCCIEPCRNKRRRPFDDQFHRLDDSIEPFKGAGYAVCKTITHFEDLRPVFAWIRTHAIQHVRRVPTGLDCAESAAQCVFRGHGPRRCIPNGIPLRVDAIAGRVRSAMRPSQPLAVAWPCPINSQSPWPRSWPSHSSRIPSRQRNFIPLFSAVPSQFDALVGRCLGVNRAVVVVPSCSPWICQVRCVEIRREREAGESGKRFHLRAAEINGADVPLEDR